MEVRRGYLLELMTMDGCEPPRAGTMYFRVCSAFKGQKRALDILLVYGSNLEVVKLQFGSCKMFDLGPGTCLPLEEQQALFTSESSLRALIVTKF